MLSRLSHRVGLDDLVTQVRLSEPRWSTDESQILLAVSRSDLDHDTTMTEIVAVDARSGVVETWASARSGVRHARWSGEGITLLAPVGGRTQIHRIAAPGASARAVTAAPEGVRSFVEHATSGFVYAADAPARAPLQTHNRSFEVGEHSFLAQEPPRRTQLWHVDTAGRIRSLTPEEGVNHEQAVPNGAPSYALSPDGMTVAFLGQPLAGERGVLELTLQSVSLETGYRHVHLDTPKALAAPAWDGQGGQLAVLAPRGPVPLYDPRGAFVLYEGALHPATPDLDRDLHGLAWLPSGDLVVWGPHRTQIGVWVQSPEAPPRLLDLGGVDPISEIAVSPKGRLAFVGVRPSAPPELFVLDRLDGPLRCLTSTNARLGSCERAPVETVTWTGPEGREQDGVLVLPPDFDPTQRYPLVVSLHGGPMGASTRGWSDLRQLLAARGWLVFCPNYRGSNHRGAEFQRAILGDPAAGPAADILAGIEALRSRGIVDDARRAVTGWSYGGYLAAWLCGTSPDFAAAVVGAPVVDWRDAYVLSDLGPWFGHALGGAPWERPAEYDAASPLTHLATYTTPTLVLACTGDPRVPVTHAYRLVRALQDRDTEVLFVGYPVAGHYPSSPVHQRDLLRRWLAWLRGALG